MAANQGYPFNMFAGLPSMALPVNQMNSPNPAGGGYHFPPPVAPAPQQQSDPNGGIGNGLGGLLAMLQGGGKGGGGGLGSSSSGLLGLLGMNSSPSATVGLPMGGQTTISGALPDLGSDGAGLHGLFHSLFG